MTLSDDFGIDEDETAFLEAATQAEDTRYAGGEFEPSSRPRKRQRIGRGPGHVDGASSDECESAEASSEEASAKDSCRPAREARRSETTHTQQHTISDDEPEDDPDYYFPGEVNQEKKHSKYRIHIPKNVQPLEDRYFTQTQTGLDTSPGAIRGAVWKRPPRPPPPPTFSQNARKVAVSAQAIAASHSKTGVPVLSTLSSAIKVTRAAEVARDGTLSVYDVRLENSRGSGFGAQNNLSEPRNRQVIATQQKQLSIDVLEELADLPSDAFSSSSPEKQPAEEPIIISSQVRTSQPQPARLRGPQAGLKQMTLWGAESTQQLTASQAAKKRHAWPLKNKDEPPTHHKLLGEAMKTWVYPTNLGTIRDYQYNIVARSLFHNALVALPTGLGKTFIAATVMLNYYRWTTDAQIVFMAPTKPLIAQQMEACYHICGIPRRDTVLMTGETSPAARADEWLEKRVFFMTPQTVINDLKTGICDPKKIVCVVVDEAHKATGGYAYTEVVAFLRRFNTSFRVLALTATPGSSVEAVQSVVDNLGIARVELRTEQSLDIRQYTHEKHTETELFEYSDEQVLVMEHLSKALKPVLDKLNSQNAYWSRDPMQLTAYGLQQARGKWMGSDAGRRAPQSVKGMINSIFTVLSQLGHGISLLKNHGIGPFYGNVLEFQKNVENGQMKMKYAKQIVEHGDWIKMMSFIRQWTNNPDFIGHPKLQYLREVVLNHFLDAGDGRQGNDVPPAATRIMVFASYRDSTEEICRVLKRNDPMVRPHVFVGQQASKDSEGMNQKRQNEVIQQFKTGKFNTLVATSIGEEGLDIGDVDLIICYDASSSPIRMLQRIGRTGRKRVGRVVLLLMKGKEENDYAKAQDNYSYIQKTIADTNRYNYHDEQSPRILPKTAQPIVDKRVIDIPPENSQPIDLNEKNRKGKGKGKQKRPPKKFHMPDGVRTGFTRASRLDESDDTGDEASISPHPKAKMQANRVKRRQSVPEPDPQPEPDPVQLPYLEDVLLNDSQQKALERTYANIAEDDANGVVVAPNFTRFPAMLRQLGQTKYLRHGRAASTVARAMTKAHAINSDDIDRLKQTFSVSDLEHDRTTRSLLIDPHDAAIESEAELPAAPEPLPLAKKTRGRPRKVDTTGAKRTTVETTSTPKPRGRPRKAQTVQRTASYGSAAMEGDESEPEPTPANMRIATQGIDLGSHDTSGEDELEEADSELEQFVVGSDLPIETLSSSLPGTLEVTRKRRNITSKAKRIEHLMSSDDDDAGANQPLPSRDIGDVGSDVEDGSEPEAVFNNVRQGKKRRVVEDSDSDV